MRIWIGTSGFVYRDWVGPFYPPGSSTTGMLRHYSHNFSLVELNFTFYRPPTPRGLLRLAEQTPREFQFWVKLPRSLSHEERTDDLDSFRDSAQALDARGQLSGLLCQLPQATHRTDKHLAWLAKLVSHLAPYQMAVEFRHRSWFAPDITHWLAERKINLVAVDAPNLPNLYPSGPVRSGRNMYVRFHSRNGANWYLTDKQRYDYTFSDADLNGWIDQVRADAGDLDNVYLLFNNCYRGQAVVDALRMKELFGRRAPELPLVTPPTISEPSRQGWLFE